MRQKLGVALAVVALALSGAREAADQFGQLKSAAGAWASTNSWSSLLVYAAGTFDGIAPRRTTKALVASNSATCGDAKVARRAVKTAARRQPRPELEIAVLAISPAGADSRRSDVNEFEIGARREAGMAAQLLGRGFVAADFEAEVARAGMASELARLGVADFVLKFARVETHRGRAAVRRHAPRRKVEAPRDEKYEGQVAEHDGDAREVLFESPSSSGLFNCDEEPRR